MSTAGETKIFGMRIKVDPKILISGLILLTAAFVWVQLRGGDDDHPSTPLVRPKTASANSSGSPAGAAKANYIRRGTASKSDSAAIRLRPVDPSKGDIDPTLRLDLLSRLQQVKLVEGSRNLFESGPAIAANLPPVPVVKPMLPKPAGPITPPPNTGPVTPSKPAVNVPFRYYGFVKPGMKGDGNRGFFMEGDNILIATEGDVLEQRYLVVALTPNTARVEDIQLKEGQDLQFTPEAPVAQ
jgi:hypothetical protein